MNPGEKDCVGYTLKTLGSAFWALNHAESFEDGILKIIHEGGDAGAGIPVLLIRHEIGDEAPIDLDRAYRAPRDVGQ